jgi:hypothetical protein
VAAAYLFKKNKTEKTRFKKKNSEKDAKLLAGENARDTERERAPGYLRELRHTAEELRGPEAGGKKSELKRGRATTTTTKLRTAVRQQKTA